MITFLGYKHDKTEDVDTRTVLRAYAELRDEGLVEMRRRRDVTLIATPGQAELADGARGLVARTRTLGLGDGAIRLLVEAHLWDPARTGG